jgi:aspartyl-tRNA(Asn)/glutamyl-tRNA(Gln) amidotransferase subunit B
VDLNRAGTPLAEIVSEPDIRSPAEARVYLTTLKQILAYAEVSDCSMEQGSLRVDANISIRKAGDSTFGVKCEVKNLNSFANVERALTAERDRQIGLVESGQRITQSTLLFNAGTGQVRLLRSKEESHDYRYFPDPDLPPLVLTQAWIDEQRGALPELPDAKRERLVMAYGLSLEHARVIAADRAIASYFEAVVAAGAEAQAAANWVMGDALAGYNAAGHFTVAPARLAELTRLVAQNKVSQQAAKRVFASEDLANPSTTSTLAIAEKLGLTQVSDTDALGSWVDEVLVAFPKEVERYRAGETKLIAFFVGQVMKRSQGKADPKGVQPVLAEKLRA